MRPKNVAASLSTLGLATEPTYRHSVVQISDSTAYLTLQKGVLIPLAPPHLYSALLHGSKFSLSIASAFISTTRKVTFGLCA